MCDRLVPRNLISGFCATGIYPLNRQVLKRLPDSSQDPGGAGTTEALNDSVMELLRSHCSLTQTPERPVSQRRGRKVVPGRAITLEDYPDSKQPSTSHHKQHSSAPVRSKSSDGGASTITTSVQPNAADTDEWICADCKESWKEDADNRWIVCDVCDRQ